MIQKGRLRKKYPSDLTDEQWAIVAPLIPPAKQNTQGGRPRQVDMREVLNTLFYLNRSGCQWDMLPHDLLPKSTAYDYFVQWRDDGTWAKMVKARRERTRREAGREPTLRYQDTPHLMERGELVWEELEALLTHHGIERRIRQRHAQDVPLQPFDRRMRRGSARRCEHASVDVKTHHTSGRADAVYEETHDDSRAAGQVQHAFPWSHP